jgi:F0F1-type ATP synthase assembly protein I
MHPHKPGNNYSRYLSLGAEITAAMLVPLAGGYLIDYYFGTEPWGFLGGMVVGFLSVFSAIYRIAVEANSDNNKRKSDDEKRR